MWGGGGVDVGVGKSVVCVVVGTGRRKSVPRATQPPNVSQGKSCWDNFFDSLSLSLSHHLTNYEIFKDCEFALGTFLN